MICLNSVQQVIESIIILAGAEPQLTRCGGKLGSSPYFGAFLLDLKGDLFKFCNFLSRTEEKRLQCVPSVESFSSRISSRHFYTCRYFHPFHLHLRGIGKQLYMDHYQIKYLK